MVKSTEFHLLNVPFNEFSFSKLGAVDWVPKIDSSHKNRISHKNEFLLFRTPLASIILKVSVGSSHSFGDSFV